MAFKLKKLSSFKLNNDEKKYPTKKYTGPKYIGGAVPFAGGGKSKVIGKTFSKVAKNRAKMSKTIQELLEKKGYKFKSSPKSKSRGNI
jgi:hypothetical protein